MTHQASYILLGPPASGKSTQAEALQDALKLTHIDIGAELREAAKEDSPFGRELDEKINVRHELASDETMSIVLKKVIERIPEDKGILLNGAPRRASQIDEVLHVLEASGRIIRKVIFIQLSEEESIRRISKRFKCSSCKRSYILGKDLPDDKICTECGGKIEQRKDDTPEGVRTRYSIFHSETLPVIEHFRQAGKLIIIDGNKDASKVTEEILEKVGEE